MESALALSSYGFGEMVPGYRFRTPSRVDQIGAIVLFGASATLAFAGAKSGGRFTFTNTLTVFSATTLMTIALGIKHFNRRTPPTNCLGLNALSHNLPSLGKFIDKHRVFPTKNGKESAKWKLELIKKAEQSIEISGNFCGGPLFRNVLLEIEKRMQAKPNLKTHIISDFELLEDLDYKEIEKLRGAYPDQFRLLVTKAKIDFKPFRVMNNHVKLLIVDGKYFELGGTSLEDHLCKKATKPTPRSPSEGILRKLLATSFRDMDLVAKGKLAKTLRLEFFKLFAIWEHKMGKKLELNNYYFPIDDKEKKAEITEIDSLLPSRLKVVVSGPERFENACTEEYVQNLKTAKKTARIANLFFAPPKEIKREIKNALYERNVKMQILTNGLSKNSPPQSLFFSPSCRKNYLSLIKSEMEIYEWDLLDSVIHKKVLRVDDATTLIGTYNFYRISIDCDYEILATVESAEFAEKVDRILDEDLKFCKKVTMEEAAKYRKYLFLRRFFGKIFFLSP